MSMRADVVGEPVDDDRLLLARSASAIWSSFAMAPALRSHLPVLKSTSPWSVMTMPRSSSFTAAIFAMVSRASFSFASRSGELLLLLRGRAPPAAAGAASASDRAPAASGRADRARSAAATAVTPERRCLLAASVLLRLHARPPAASAICALRWAMMARSMRARARRARRARPARPSAARGRPRGRRSGSSCRAMPPLACEELVARVDQRLGRQARSAARRRRPEQERQRRDDSDRAQIQDSFDAASLGSLPLAFCKICLRLRAWSSACEACARLSASCASTRATAMRLAARLLSLSMSVLGLLQVFLRELQVQLRVRHAGAPPASRAPTSAWAADHSSFGGGKLPPHAALVTAITDSSHDRRDPHSTFSVGKA